MDRIHHRNSVGKPFPYAGTHCIPAEKISISPDAYAGKIQVVIVTCF
jgi:hypothetical protein